jgi:ubiquinone biosynthesis protein Coq4
MCSVHVDRRKGKFQHIIKLNDTLTSNETITEVKEDMLTKETDQLIQEEGNSLVSMYH